MGRVVVCVVLGLAVAGVVAFVLSGPGEDPQDVDLGGLDAGGHEEAGGPALQAMGARHVRLTGGRPGSFLVTGRVLDEKGEPVVGVAIEARRTGVARDFAQPQVWMETTAQRIRSTLANLNRPEAARARVDARTESGADGSFRIELSRTGSYDVHARPQAPLFGTSKSVNLHEGKLEQEIELQVRLGSRLSGRVLSRTGLPLSATIRGSWWSREGNTSYSWLSEPVESKASDGSFVFESVPPGTVRLSFTLADGRRVSGITVETPHDGLFVVHLDDATGGIECTVTDMAGAPIEDALVLISVTRAKDDDQAGGSQLAHGKTNAEGVCSIPGAPLGTVSSLSAVAEGFLGRQEYAARSTWQGAKVATEGVLKLALHLERGGTVFGVVKERGGASPVADVQVTLHPIRSSGVMPTAVRLPPVQTDAEGRYRVEGIARGRYLALCKKKGWYLPQQGPGRQQQMGWQPNGEGAPIELMAIVAEDGVVVERDLILARGIPVRGRVVDASGAGVAEAEILAQGYGLSQMAWRWGIQPGPQEPLATSGPDGAFDIEGLPAHDSWVLYARKEGYAGKFGASIALEAGATTPEVRLELLAGGTIRGRVEGLDEGTGKQAQIGFWGVGAELAADRSFRKIAADGTFEITGLPPGTWTLNLWMNGRQGTQQQVADLKAGEVREGVVVELKQGVEVSGILVDEEGDPVPQQSLYLVSKIGMGGWTTGATDKDGRFEFQGVKEGGAQLMVLDGSRQRLLGPVFDAPARDLRIVFEKEPVRLLKGRVVDPEGNPIPVARIQITAAKSDPGATPQFFVPGGSGSDVLNGEFEVQVTGDPPFTATIRSPRGEDGQPMNFLEKVHELGAAEGEILITLEAGQELRGRVVDAKGSPVAGVSLRAGKQTVRTDERGSFRMPGLPAGTVSLTIGPVSGYINLPNRQVDSAQTDLRITLEKGLAIRGRAEGPDGNPLKGGWLSATWKTPGTSGVGNASAQLKPNGRFMLDGFPPDASVSITLQVWNQGGGTAYAPTQVREVRPGTDDLVIRVGSGLTIEGRVVGHDGKPAASVFVGATSDDGSNVHTGWVQTDAKGRWKLAGLKPVPYLVRVMSQGGAAAPKAVRTEPPATDIRIVLPRSITLSGRIPGLSETEARKWLVRVIGEDGTLKKTAKVQADGSWQVPGVSDEGKIRVGANTKGDERYALTRLLSPGTQKIVLSLRQGQSISGVIDRSAAPEGALRVFLSRGGWQQAGEVEPDGSFTIRGLPDGTYTVSARSGRARAVQAGLKAGARDVQLRLAVPK